MKEYKERIRHGQGRKQGQRQGDKRGLLKKIELCRAGINRWKGIRGSMHASLLSILILERQFDHDLCSPVRLTLKGNFPLVRINHFFCDRHSQPGALGLF